MGLRNAHYVMRIAWANKWHPLCPHLPHLRADVWSPTVRLDGIHQALEDIDMDDKHNSGTSNQGNTLLLGTEPATPPNGTTTAASTSVGAPSATVADKRDQHGKSLFASFAGKTRRFAFPGRKGVA